MLYKKKYLKYKYKYLQLIKLLEGGALVTDPTITGSKSHLVVTDTTKTDTTKTDTTKTDTTDTVVVKEDIIERLPSGGSQHTMLSRFALILNRMTEQEIVDDRHSRYLASYNDFINKSIKDREYKGCIYIIDYANIVYNYDEVQCSKLLDNIYENMLVTEGIVFIISKPIFNHKLSIDIMLNLHKYKEHFKNYLESNHLNIFNINIPDRQLQHNNPIDDLFFWFIATSCFLTLHYSNVSINAIKLITMDKQKYDKVIFSGSRRIIDKLIINKVNYVQNKYFSYFQFYPSQYDSIIFKNFLNVVGWNEYIYLFLYFFPTNYILLKEYYTDPRFYHQAITISGIIDYDNLFYDSLNQLQISDPSLFGQCVNQIIAQIFDDSQATHYDYFIKINEFFNAVPKKYHQDLNFTYRYFNSRKKVIVYNNFVYDIRNTHMTYSLYFMCLFKYIHYILTRSRQFDCTTDDVNRPYPSLSNINSKPKPH